MVKRRYRNFVKNGCFLPEKAFMQLYLEVIGTTSTIHLNQKKMIKVPAQYTWDDYAKKINQIIINQHKGVDEFILVNDPFIHKR